MTQKHVYFFGGKKAEGNADMRNLLGGKGANLAEMVNIGIPVPAGFTITTAVCTGYYDNNQKWPAGLEDQIKEAIGKVEADMGAKFGDPKNPLLFAVRSGARVSMPGMMDTVLNLGLNDTTIKGLIEQSNDERFAYDSYRRFLQMYGDVVMNVDHDLFEEIIQEQKDKKGVDLDTELEADDWKIVVEKFKALIKKETGRDFPTDPFEQLRGSINAVFESWFNPRAQRYRELNDIPHDWGTAVNVQAMVFGNMGNHPETGKGSGSGVAFTRDPATGENIFYGEYLMNAQGEDVVAGIRTPLEISTLKKDMPEVYASYMVELVDRLTEEYDPNEKVYSLLVATFRQLKTDGLEMRLTRFFELNFLRLIGIEPQLERCVGCDSILTANSEKLCFSPREGGALCSACQRTRTDALPLSLGAYQVMRWLATADIARLAVLQMPNTSLIEALEWILLQDALIQVCL
jgi:pyruvate,orthophosphate dikinase